MISSSVTLARLSALVDAITPANVITYSFGTVYSNITVLLSALYSTSVMIAPLDTSEPSFFTAVTVTFLFAKK